MDEPTRTHRSKVLSMWLRHKPERGGLTLSPEGWAAIPEVLAAFEQQESPLSRAELDSIVRIDPKGRFEVEGDRIRARYGHSLALEAKPHPGMPPATLFHGTTRRFVPRILQSGLRPMKRQFVHLSPDKKTAREVGRRRDQQPVILIVEAHRAHEAGVQFYPRGRGIWLSDPIPAEFLRVLEESPYGQPNEEDDAPAVAPQKQWARGTGGQGAKAPARPPGERRRRPKGGFMKPSRE